MISKLKMLGAFVAGLVLAGAIVEGATGSISNLQASNYRAMDGQLALKVVVIDAAGDLSSISGGIAGTVDIEFDGVTPSVDTGVGDTGTLRTIEADDSPLTLSSVAIQGYAQSFDTTLTNIYNNLGRYVAVDAVPATTSGPWSMFQYAANDGAQAAQTAVEGRGVIGLASDTGVPISTLFNYAGSKPLYNAEDTASADLDPLFLSGCLAQSTAATTSGSNNDYEVIKCDRDGNIRTLSTEGGIAIAHGANPTAVAAAARSPMYTNRAGIPFVIGGHPNVITETVTVTDSDGAQTGVAIVTVSAGTKIVVTRAGIRCSADNSAKPDFRLAFDTDGTFTAASTTGTVGHIDGADDIVAGGGFSIGAGAGILGVGADDEDLRYSLSDPVGGSCVVSVSYYTIES